MQLLFETDWLGSRPVFFNELTNCASYNVNDVIGHSNLEFDPEGFAYFLDFGYSILGLTPLRNIKVLRYSSKIYKDENGKLFIENLEDPIYKWLDWKLSEADIFDLLKEKVNCWENENQGEIIIPTSGGYDSRLLNWAVKEKSRIRAFTYGISDNQFKSFEVVYASMLSKKLGIRWETIELGDYHQYINEWYKYFGISTHAHGMYHIEFFKKILSETSGNKLLLSGIIGDAWAGSVKIDEIKCVEDVKKLGYSHGMHADSKMSKIRSEHSILEEYFQNQKNILLDSRIRIIESMRFKMILLSYLLTIPRVLGFKPWSPYLDIDLAMAMLNLPEERRMNRKWEEDFFNKEDLDFEKNRFIDFQNTLNIQALKRIPVSRLDESILCRVIEPQYVRWINSCLKRTGASWEFLRKMKSKRVLNRLSSLLNLDDSLLPAYFAYLTLKPIEILLSESYH
jgi:hypothetical protein